MSASGAYRLKDCARLACIPSLIRSAAIKTKMTRKKFTELNTSLDSLAGIPAAFFDGLYGEIIEEGLPVSDTVPVAPVHSASSDSSALRMAALAVVRPLSPLVGATLAGVRSGAGVAMNWLRRSIVSATALSQAVAH